jgi:hypothetical protein
MAKTKRKWIQGAIKRPGSFSKKAKRAGMSTQAYARKERNAPGRLGKQARLAMTLKKMHRGKKRGKRTAKRR